MAKLKILVVDDDKEIAELVQIHLESEGYQVITAHDAVTGLNILSKEKDISLAVVDIMMPGMNGLTMCDKIREKSPIPIIILSAKSTDLDKIVGLGKGADDYVTKPFNPAEVIARVGAMLRRYTKLGSDIADKDHIVVGGLELNNDSRQIFVDGEAANLTPKEFEILRFLMMNKGKTFSPAEIYKAVWHEEPLSGDKTIAVHIRHIREKIEIDPADPRYIKVVFGRGYILEG